MFPEFRKDQFPEDGSSGEVLADGSRTARDARPGESPNQIPSSTVELQESFSADLEPAPISQDERRAAARPTVESPDRQAVSREEFPDDASPGHEGAWLEDLPSDPRVRQHPRPRGKRLAAPGEHGKKRSLAT